VKAGPCVLRRGEAQVLRSLDGKLESRPLTPSGTSSLVEMYELKLHARAAYASDAHAPGTRELVVVLSGALRLYVENETIDLHAGDSACFVADVPHRYENPGATEVRFHNVILYER